MTRILAIEHQPSCPPALLGQWLEANGVELVVARPWTGEALPDASQYDALLVLGGSMDAYGDDSKHPWLSPVKQQIRDAVAAGLPTLGVCLGHQLMTEALGGEAAPNPRGQTVGLRDVGWTEHAATDDLFAGVADRTGGGAVEARGVHWNDDIALRLPPGAVVLATTVDGAPQVVRYADRAWGVQLHPEATAEVVRAWAEDDRDRHLASGVDQEALLADIEDAQTELNETWAPLAEAFARLAARG